MDTYTECCRQYIDHFKSTFQYVSEPSFNEGIINMGITNDTSDQVHKQRGEIDRSHLWFKFLGGKTRHFLPCWAFRSRAKC